MPDFPGRRKIFICSALKPLRHVGSGTIIIFIVLAAAQDARLATNPAPAHSYSTPAATVSDGTLGPAAGSTPVTILAALAALTPWPLLARAGTV